MEYQCLTKDYSSLEAEGKFEDACHALEEEISFNLALVHNKVSETKIPVLDIFSRSYELFPESMSVFEDLRQSFLTSLQGIRPERSSKNPVRTLNKLKTIRSQLEENMKKI
jgi:hypothetical protein